MFRFESLHEAENMASIVDGYCCLRAKSNSIWTRLIIKKDFELNNKIASNINRKSFDHYHINLNKQSIGSPSKLIYSVK